MMGLSRQCVGSWVGTLARIGVATMGLAVLIAGCQIGSPSDAEQRNAPGDELRVGKTAGSDGDTPTTGEIHNEFLGLIFERIDARVSQDGPNAVSPANKDDIAFHVANELAAKYGAEPLSMEAVRSAIEQGRKMAMQDPVELVKSALPPDEYKWWDRFASEAEVENARQVYEEMSARYGEPEPGSVLSELVDIAVNSAEFWAERHAEDEPVINTKGDDGPQKGWKKNILRFITIVATDAVAGGLAAGGGGGPVGGAIVGGLASQGADGILFD